MARKSVSITLDPEVYEVIKDMAEKDRRSVSSMIWTHAEKVYERASTAEATSGSGGTAVSAVNSGSDSGNDRIKKEGILAGRERVHVRILFVGKSMLYSFYNIYII